MRWPLLLYRWNLSWILGQRFLRLHHRGRRSGRWYEAVLEVVRYDASARRLIVASGWGFRSDWYRNLLRYPEVQVDFGGRRLDAYAIPLQLREGERELQHYQQNHPWLSALLEYWLGPLEQVRLYRLEILSE
ncbi:MAG: nitroreductase family deazaflavin-dependent oxidoreductase [Candidatus Eremiobacteraeota bacterium]|nr:nitroreductase family deazaflavin-dependent oxidoreductase [Candidatus Eremiobacteraeota bacterium]MCW5870578.1 nitroreductase family deazaflavin-dependent oxidoreductase [Candidatus Eremiobacteraeota bacterium]